VSLTVLIPTFESEMSGVLSKLLDEQFLPPISLLVRLKGHYSDPRLSYLRAPQKV